MRRYRKKLTAAEKKKRAERNERRGRKSERKSDEPRVASARLLVGPPGLGMANPRPENTRRMNDATLANAKKWEGTPPCSCARCVARREKKAA